MYFEESQSSKHKNIFCIRTSVTIVCSFLIMLFGLGTQSIFGIFFAPILNELGWTRAMLSGAFSVSWIISGLMGIVMGALCDKYGSRGILTACGILLGAGFALMHQLASVWQFYLVYGVIIGIGISGIWVPVMSTIARNFVEKRSIVTAIAMTGSGIGSLAAPPVSNWLIANYDWRTAYFIIGITIFVVVTTSAQFVETGKRPIRIKTPEQSEAIRARGISLTHSLTTTQFWLLLIMVFCFGFCAYTVIVHLVPHALYIGINSSTAANILAVSGGVAIIGRLGLGAVSRRISNKAVCIIGFPLMAISSFGFIFTEDVGILFLLSALFGFGFGLGVIISPFVAEIFGLKSHGAILGIIVLGYSTGSAVGPLLAGNIFDIYNSYQLAFILNAAIACIGLLLSFLIKPILVPRE